MKTVPVSNCHKCPFGGVLSSIETKTTFYETMVCWADYYLQVGSSKEIPTIQTDQKTNEGLICHKLVTPDWCVLRNGKGVRITLAEN